MNAKVTAVILAVIIVAAGAVVYLTRDDSSGDIKGITNYGTIGSGDGILGLATPLLRLRFRDRL